MEDALSASPTHWGGMKGNNCLNLPAGKEIVNVNSLGPFPLLAMVLCLLRTLPELMILVTAPAQHFWRPVS